MADAARASIPATAAAEELLQLTSKVLTALEREMAELEDAQASKQAALRQLVDRDREAVTRATNQLNDLYRAAREIADNKGRRDTLEGVLRLTVEADPDRTFDEVVEQLQKEMKLARGITGAMRVPEIGALLNQAAVQVDHLEARADALEANLREAAEGLAGSTAQAAFHEASASLRRDLDAFDATLPLTGRAWDTPDWIGWDPTGEPSPLVRFGRFTDDRLDAAGIPALLDAGSDAGLLFEPGRNREQAVAAAQSVALRLLAGFPPGSARVTFVDPSALGESATAFQRLVSGDEAGLVRVLTDERSIEDALADLVDDTDGSGRREVVVVFDHPTGMSLRGITLLRSLTDSGARRSVTTVVVKDPRPGRQPAEARALPALRTIKPAKTGFTTVTGDGNWRVDLDAAPEPGLLNEILARVEARAENPVVSTAIDLGDDSTWWTGDATGALNVHIDPQRGDAIDLDDSTPTLVLTGSSESVLATWFHAFVIDACITHSPGELQLSMIGLGARRDLEAYGHRRLPHARLVATNADRELAVSALESAAAEITRRLVLFQAAGTARGGYRQYREETGNVLPRLVVLVAGAGVLFAHHDKLAHHAHELLARFELDGGVTGVHVVLAASDGAGTPALPDDAVGASAKHVSVAADLEANTMGPTERDGALRALRIRAEAEHLARAPQVVDGRDVARIEDAPLDLLHAREPRSPALARMWLGEPAALGSPVEVVLPRREGANVLVVHPRSDIGQGLLASALLTAVLADPGQLELHVLDFMPVEDGFGEAVLPLGALARITVTRRRNLQVTIDAVRNTVVNRLARNRHDAPPCLLVLNGLDAAHDLMPTNGSPARIPDNDLAHLEQIVREGPAVGVHTLLWGTSLETLDRCLTRDTWRGFALRVVGPLDGATSQTLIDSPAAASLRPHQAMLYDEFDARLVRARPYAIPDAAWLANVRATWPAPREAADVTLR